MTYCHRELAHSSVVHWTHTGYGYWFSHYARHEALTAHWCRVCDPSLMSRPRHQEIQIRAWQETIAVEHERQHIFRWYIRDHVDPLAWEIWHRRIMKCCDALIQNQRNEQSHGSIYDRRWRMNCDTTHRRQRIIQREIVPHVDPLAWEVWDRCIGRVHKQLEFSWSTQRLMAGGKEGYYD